jgi:hypothetical protein
MPCFIGCGGAMQPPPAEAVTISAQPLSQTVPLGQTATFTVKASGTSPLMYQWSKDGAEIDGATSASYTTPPVELRDGSASIGSFEVTISNASSSATSKSAALTAGPRSPKAGDLRYLLYEQVDVPGLQNGSGSGGVSIYEGIGWRSVGDAVGSPLSIGSACALEEGMGDCAWVYEYQKLPSPAAGLAMFYRPDDYSSFYSDLESYAASNVVFTSLDLDPVDGAYAISWVETAQSGGFGYRVDPLVPPGAGQAAEIQAQAAHDGEESRIVTAVSFDAAGNAVMISYGWRGDTTTEYEAQARVVPPRSVENAAISLAHDGYFISAFGGNNTNGYVLIGMRVRGDSLPRPTAEDFDTGNNAPPYKTPVVYLYDAPEAFTVLFEQ